jgi:regulator of sigma E protease
MLAAVPEWVLALAAFLVLVTPLVVLHEFGHFVVARLCGVKVDRFSVGFGRAIVSWKTRAGTEWRLAWIPLGGYVKFAGDAAAASAAVPDSEDLKRLKRELDEAEGPGAHRRYFHFKPVWQRALIVVAGPATNFLLAIALFAVMFSAIGVYLAPARIAAVSPGSPAAAAGFRVGDVITRVGAHSVESEDEVVPELMFRANVPTRFTVIRDGRPVELQATPRAVVTTDPLVGPQKTGRVGIAFNPYDVRYVRYSPLQGAREGVRQSWRLVRFTLTYIGRVATGRENGAAIGGPIGTAAVSGAAVEYAVKSAHGHAGLAAINAGKELLQLAAMLSVSVGFLNLLPIPILDGGHLLFYAYEAVARKPLGARVQEAGFRIGLALLAGLMLFATWNDLQKLSLFKNLGGLLS